MSPLTAILVSLFNEAIDSLSHKGLGALFDLRRTVDRRFINTQSHDQLFNTLITPILMYGCQIWLPTSSFINSLINNYQKENNLNKAMALIAKQPYERIHLRHIKYMLGINRRSVNAAAWGETGKHPLFINSLRLCIDYFKRISNLPNDTFARAALSDQIRLNLSWFTNIKNIIECFDNISSQDYQVSTNLTTNALLISDLISIKTIIQNTQDSFINSWRFSINNSNKLDFYKTVKSEFSWENYLTSVTNFNERRSTARIRCSAHNLNIEVGRYNNTVRSQRTCDFCSRTSNTAHVEDENHILHNCPNGSIIRSNFHQAIRDISNNIDDFNIAEICPASYISHDNYSTDTHVKIVKLTCSTIHRLYSNALRYKEDVT